MSKSFSFLIIAFFFIACKNNAQVQSTDWTSVSQQFQKGYKALDLTPLQIGYVQNLKAIKNKNDILKQAQFFQSIEKLIQQIDPKQLTKKEFLDYLIINYELELNLERIALEKKWKESKTDSISQKGLASIPNGKEWYAYFLKKWVDKSVTSDSMYTFGLKEIKKVKARMKALQEKSGMDSLAFQKHINQPSVLPWMWV